MDLERLSPFFLIWLIYTLFTSKRQARKKDVGTVVPPAPVVHGDDSRSRPQNFRAEPLMAAGEKERATRPEPTGLVVVAAARSQQESSRRRRISSRAFLRRAVVWSEILRPPVSMRSEE
jgi:hypothetical protein